MSESVGGENGGAGPGGGAGCALAAAVVGGVLLLGAIAAVVLLFFAAKYTAKAVPQKPLTAPPAPPSPPAVAPAHAAEVRVVRLTGVGDGGTWYTVDEEIHEGDEALGEALRELGAEAKRTGKRLTVRLEVQADAGVTAKHVRAAAEACRAAGAEVKMPAAESGESATPGKGAGEEGE